MRSNNRSFFGTFCIFAFLWFSAGGFSVATCDVHTGAGERGVRINVIESNQDRLLVEFLFSKPVDGRINGCQVTPQPGHPALPFKSILFASPPHSDVRYSVVKTVKSELGPVSIPPAPSPVFMPRQPGDGTSHITAWEHKADPRIYATDAMYPAELCRVEKGGFFRNVYVQSLIVYPLRYNPVTKKTEFYQKMIVRLTFHHQQTPGKSAGGQDHDIFHRLNNSSIINAGQADLWSAARTLQSAPLQKSVFSGERYKIEIDREGLYRFYKSDLEDAGLNLLGIDPRHIKLFHRDNELPIYIYGEEDGYFHDTDYIEFYATGIKSRYTRLNVYWLIVDSSPGKRVTVKNGNPAGTTTIITRTREKYHYERDKYYETSIPGGAEQDHFFWDYIIAPKTLNFSLRLDHVSAAASSPPAVRYVYQGFSATTVDPDHHTIVFLNGEKIADDRWDGQIQYSNQVNCPQSILQNGENTLTVRLPGDTGSNVDIVWINWFEIEYWRDLTANSNYVTFSSRDNGTRQFQVTGFGAPDILVYDVTDTLHPKRISNIKTENIGGAYTALFQDKLSGIRKYMAVAGPALQKPVSFSKVNGAGLGSPSNRADYIVITHKNFYPAIDMLAQYRRDQGLKVKIVTIDDVFNEFNDGIKHPSAIRNFLNAAYHNWYQPAPPSFVLLVGDATYDPRNVLGFGDHDYVPTHLFETGTYHTETSSDNWFACVNGDDDIPDMLVGRIPARTSSQVEQFVQKIKNYEKTTLGDGWVKDVLFIADNADEGGNFETTSDQIAENVTSPFNVQKIYLRDAGSAGAARSAIINQFNKGCLFANYLGHGSLDNWASETMFGKTDVNSLTNNLRFPIVVTLSCLNGFFHHAENAYCLSEEFLLGNQRGAVACYTPSGFGYASADKILADGLYASIFKNQNGNLGSAILESKLALTAAGEVFNDHVKFFNLFGDPATKLPIKTVSTPQSAYFYGQLRLFGEKAPPGTVVSAWVKGIKCSADLVVEKAGKFGLLQVWADNPATGIKEGAVNNDKVGFQIVYGKNDTAFAVPSVIWKTATTRQVDLNVIHDPDTPVKVENVNLDIWIDDKKVGDQLLDGDTVSGTPAIKAKIHVDPSAVFTTDQLSVRLDDIEINPEQLFHRHETDGGSQALVVEFKAGMLDDGAHKVCFELSTVGAGLKKSFNFNIDNRLGITDVMNYPNPMQETTCFTYYLTNDGPARVSIKIYSVAGRLLRVIEYAPGDVGFNNLYWDGRDGDGDMLANGVYFYKIIVRDGPEHAEHLAKLVIAN